MTEMNYDEMEAVQHDELKAVVLDWLKDNDVAATMPYQEFYESITAIIPAQRETLAVTVTLMELNGEVKITKDENGRGIGFSVP